MVITAAKSRVLLWRVAPKWLPIGPTHYEVNSAVLTVLTTPGNLRSLGDLLPEEYLREPTRAEHSRYQPGTRRGPRAIGLRPLADSGPPDVPRQRQR